MSPPLLDDEGGGKSNASSGNSSSSSIDCLSQNGSGLKERNYLGLSDCSSVDSSGVSTCSEASETNLNLKATELRLGLPSLFPERDSEPTLPSSTKLDEKPLFPLLPSTDKLCSSTLKTIVSGNKRGFLDTVDTFTEGKGSLFTDGKWMFHAAESESEASQAVGEGKFTNNSRINLMLPAKSSAAHTAIMKEMPIKASQEQPHATNGLIHNKSGGCNNGTNAPAAKAQVVGWPPIRSFRKQTLASSSKNNDEVDGKPNSGALFVKVSMAGAPYLRKVDLRIYSTYQELSTALEKMFSCFTIGQCKSQGTPGREMLCESKLRDLLHGSEYVLTYEDKDGDWMLVGDVPWEMFIDSCKRLKIMKGSDAIGLAPKAMEKSKNRSQCLPWQCDNFPAK